VTRLSVVIPAYNHAAFVCHALDSIAAQTEPPDEVILVDNGSTDDTHERVRGHRLRERVRYHRLAENRGAAVARNTGVSLAKGELIVFLDSDDMLEPDHHATVREAFSTQADLGLYACDARLIDETGAWLREQRTYVEIQCCLSGRSIRTGRRSVSDVFLFSTLFAGFAVKRDLYLSVGGLDQQMFPLEDYDLQLRMTGAGHALHYEHRPLARYRMHLRNASGPTQGVFVQEQRLRCIRLAYKRFPAVRQLRRAARRRIGEVSRELAFAQLKAGLWRRGLRTLIPALRDDPAGVRVIGRIVWRKVRLSSATVRPDV
jgi:glycosyltransferase involved in cell wall biosynthesis